MRIKLVQTIMKVLVEKHLAQLDFMKARYEILAAVAMLKLHSYDASQYTEVGMFIGTQNTDGIFPNAAIAKKLGEVMGDSSKDISHKSDK